MYLLCMICYDAYEISHECRVLEIKNHSQKGNNVFLSINNREKSIYIYRELLFRRGIFNIIFSIVNMK